MTGDYVFSRVCLNRGYQPWPKGTYLGRWVPTMATGVLTLDGGTYPGLGVYLPWMRTYLPWLGGGGVPTLDEWVPTLAGGGVYLPWMGGYLTWLVGCTYLRWGGSGYLNWMGVHTLDSGGGYLPWPGGYLLWMGVLTLGRKGGTYLGWEVPTLDSWYLSWIGGGVPTLDGRVPTLDIKDTYLGQGVPTFDRGRGTYTGLGSSSPLETDQHSEYLLRGVRYASCIQAGGLLVWNIYRPHMYDGKVLFSQVSVC